MKCVIIALLVILIILYFKKGTEKFEDNIPFPDTYVINLKDHSNRLQHMDNQLNELGIQYTKIEAVDAKNTEDSNIQQVIENWPCLGKKERPGTKGIQLSNLKVFEHALENPGNSPYILMLEDDCVFPKDFKEKVIESIERNPDASVISFDDRCYMKVNLYPKHGMSAILIKRDILDLLIREMTPETSEYMKKYKSSHRNYDTKKPGRCYHDVLFFNLLFNENLKVKCIPLVGSNVFKSSINPDNALWWHKDS